jgi:RsiW-degrading membrane proteinase PrsW (M82 family)
LAGGIYDRHNSEQFSIGQRNRIFIQDLCLNLVPPLMFVWNTFLDPNLKNLQQKIQVALVMFFIRYVTAWELCRLKSGGISARE